MTQIVVKDRPDVITDLADPVMFSNPFPRYAELRAEAPVSRVRSKQLLRGSGYMVTRYQDVMQVHTDARFSSNLFGGGKSILMKLTPKMLRVLSDSMVFKDDPDHKRLRALVNKAFTPRRVQDMNDQIGRIVEEMVDRLAQHDVVDLVSDFAIPLPLAVIAAMMGVTDRDREQFHHAVSHLFELSGGTVTETLRAMPMTSRLMKLLARLAEERRSSPDEGLISAIVAAHDDGDKLDRDEVVAMTFLLLLAGHDTTANLIGSSMLELLEHPEQADLLRNDPSLARSAVEELLRFTTPVPCGVARTALEDVELSGVTIPKGSKVMGMIISANRDETVFEDPDRLDLGRDPNRHLAFAFGNHYCLGNQLARIEAAMALTALLRRFPNARLEVPRDQLGYKPTQSLRGLRSLPLRLR